MRDLASNLKVVQVLGPDSLSADNTPIAIDRGGFETVMLTIGVGVGGITFTNTNKIEFVLTHSDDDVTYVAVTDDDVQGVTGTTGGIVKSLKTAHAAADIIKIGYVGDRRFLKLLADFGGTHGSPTPISVAAVLGNPRLTPVT
ncbi:hypothetical protein FNL55_00395 [Tardiphaga sp. vice352]|uniref:hypothetical protein n=1 Tax=Tardiphaga sp. vice352 TaxID=2592816 RepID=UPI001165C054|nr:hypothetical protein [Tardiphaga sp. vice352]QDM29972.1 hypothetical protein FNL55_00395 [Tardiphaga sp. vice352]